MIINVVCKLFQLSTDFTEGKYGDTISWTVTSSSGLSRVSRLLHTEQPHTLEVDILGVVSTPALRRFFQAIQKYFTGLLEFQLKKSYLEYDNCDKSLAVFMPDFK